MAWNAFIRLYALPQRPGPPRQKAARRSRRSSRRSTGTLHAIRQAPRLIRAANACIVGAMRNVTVTKLSKPVRAFLARARKGRGLVVEDTKGRGWVGVIPYDEPAPQTQQAALKRIGRIQAKVGRVMRAKGKTEEEFDRLLADI